MMDDNELGNSLDRLKAVNDLSLKMSEEKCLDHTYKSMVNIFYLNVNVILIFNFTSIEKKILLFKLLLKAKLFYN